MRASCIFALGVGLLLAMPQRALACGGFFCNRQPVDQQAERIIFAVEPDGTTMIVQIAYTGDPDDFAWILPVADVPDRDSLGTFPAAAITALDVNTAPMFFRPEDPDCWPLKLNGGGADDSTPGVTVHIDEIVGPYEVAVIEGATADPLFTWLEDRDYQLGAEMRPVLSSYVDAGMKLLALRLGPNAATNDIEPFKMTLPPGPPSIPIRLTAVAAEPEMGFLVFIFAEERWGPANWSELEIDPATLVWGSHAWPAETDWLRRVASDADADGGRAWVTEMAGPTDALRDAIMAAMTSSPEQAEARDALLTLATDHAYLTRLYARLSPDEMTVDPIFRASGGEDVPRERQLARYVDGVDLCRESTPDPCAFTACGSGATCVPVSTESWPWVLPGCSCADGASGRATVDPTNTVVAACQRVESYLSPGELGFDPCDGYDCGDGTCLPISATPTCACDPDRVAIGFVFEGVRRTLCVDPAEVVPREVLEPTAPPVDDAGIPFDAAPEAGTAPLGAVGGGGCACSVGADEPAPLPGVVLVLAVLLTRSRSRSVRRWQRR